MTNRPRIASAAQTLEGVLIGAAVGDALGLPAENLSPSRIHRLWNGEWRMRFFFGKGMISDDTEHTIIVAQALLGESKDSEAFQKLLARKLRWWFAALPAGVGLATARACIKLWLGFPANNAAVRSAGSGPAMRSAIIGAYFANDAIRRRDFVFACSRVTHRSWQAETAALAVAECTAYGVTCAESPGAEFFNSIASLSQESEWQSAIAELQRALAAKLPVKEFAARLGLSNGVTGYSLHVAWVAMYSWSVHWKDFRAALVSVLDCGGDTDTAGAIVGAIAGAATTSSGIPDTWKNSIAEWPRSTNVMSAIARRLSEQRQCGETMGPVQYFWPGVPFRNAFFLLIVVFHGFRRLFPSY